MVDMGSAENELGLDMLGMDKCELHGQTVRFYCGDHDELCCNLCALVTGKHRGCDNFKELNDVGDEQTVDKTSSSLRSVLRQATTLLDYYERQDNELTLQHETLIMNITDHQTRLVQQFDEARRDLFTEVSAQRECLFNKLGECKNVISKLKVKSDGNMQWLNTALIKGILTQRFMAVHTIYNDIVVSESQINEHEQKLKTYKMKPDYVDELRKATALVNGVSQIQFDIIPSGIPSNLKLKHSTDQAKTGDNNEPFYSGLAFLSDDRVFIVDNKNGKCRILNEKLEIVGSSYMTSYYILSACTVTRNIVAVTTCQPGVDILKIGDNDITLIKTLKTACRYDSISMMDDSTFIASTYNDHRPVRMISIDGVESDLTTVTFPDKTYKVDESYSAYIPGRDTLVITDRHDATVYMYNIKDNTKIVIKDERIKRPRGICVGDNDNVYVCNNDTHSIVQISASGLIVAVHDVGMKYPYVACVSENGSNMVVGNNCSGKHYIKLFEHCW